MPECRISTYELESALEFTGLTNCKVNERHSQSIASKEGKYMKIVNDINTGIPTIGIRTRQNANLAYIQAMSVHSTVELYT